jgi:hypothetical protein
MQSPETDGERLCFGLLYKTGRVYDFVFYTSYDSNADFYNQPNTISPNGGSPVSFQLHLEGSDSLADKSLIMRGGDTYFSFFFLVIGGTPKIEKLSYQNGSNRTHPFRTENNGQWRQTFHMGLTEKSHSYIGGQFLNFNGVGSFLFYNNYWFTPDDYLNNNGTLRFQVNYDQPQNAINFHSGSNLTIFNRASMWVNIDVYNNPPTGEYQYIYAGRLYDFIILSGISQFYTSYYLRKQTGEAYFALAAERLKYSSDLIDYHFPILTREPQYDL